MDKENLNEDEISLKFNALAQKLQEGKIEFSYLFKDQWISQEVNNVTVTVNSKMLSFHLIGSDRYGTWTQMGAMTVSKSHQVETFSRKIYDDYNLQGGNVLIYYGKYDEQNETLHGNWYYLQGDSRGEWTLKFKSQ
ncbi:unnamed protein product [Paramecium octaurelia]|uniref:Uncharacterized protein n=1 Tax=Paramecium octaurelia TaxID=43137 RepID=A0A8S1VL90_PAROT|nr:unnamed protein product [Paramecium octaurelia]